MSAIDYRKTVRRKEGRSSGRKCAYKNLLGALIESSQISFESYIFDK